MKIMKMEIDSQRMQRNWTDKNTHHIGTDILEAKLLLWC